MLFIEPPPVFHLCLISCGPVVLDATLYAKVGVDELTGVVGELIDLLIGIVVATLASLGAWRAPILA